MKDQSSDKSTAECPKCRTKDFTNCHSMYCPMRKESPEPSFKEKPDFEAMARAYAETFKTGEWFENIRTDAGKKMAEKIYNDYVIPLQKEIEELRKKENI